MEQLVNMDPAAKITCALDNDRKLPQKEKGIPAADWLRSKSYRNSTCPWLYPTFEENDRKWSAVTSTTCKLRGLRETARQLFATANRLKTGYDSAILTLNRLKTLSGITVPRTFAKELLRAVELAL
ncbi:hypothetical protein [Escherichia coli]|uniref:hypothetical protein n=1 Tax=Escherichia coli TaxID=562 RepID=UPI00351255DB